MPVADDASIPTWAADIRVSVAKIEGMTSQIPELGRAIEELRANTVPMSEHIKLMADVDELKERDLGQRAVWDEMVSRVPVLWEERTARAGERRAARRVIVGLTAAVSLLSIFTLLHDLGLSIALHP